MPPLSDASRGGVMLLAAAPERKVGRPCADASTAAASAVSRIKAWMRDTGTLRRVLLADADEVAVGPDVHVAAGDGRRRVGLFAEFIVRQELELVGRAQ